VTGSTVLFDCHIVGYEEVQSVENSVFILRGVHKDTNRYTVNQFFVLQMISRLNPPVEQATSLVGGLISPFGRERR